MPGTKAGGQKARQTNYERHGADFYKRIGSKGGQAGGTGGFFANRELAKIAGAKGGAMSRRGPAGTKKEKEFVWRPGEPMFSKEPENE